MAQQNAHCCTVRLEWLRLNGKMDADKLQDGDVESEDDAFYIGHTRCHGRRDALLAAADLARDLRWSAEEDQTLGMAVEAAIADPRPLANTVAAIHATTPAKTPLEIAERWLQKHRTEGLVCPEGGALLSAARAVLRRGPPPPPLPAELTSHIFMMLSPHDLPAASRTCSHWRDLAAPLIQARLAADVRTVLADLVCEVVADNAPEYESDGGPPVSGGVVSGECIDCGVWSRAFSQCLSCGAPVEPFDGSYHFSFGWVEGPHWTHQAPAR